MLLKNRSRFNSSQRQHERLMKQHKRFMETKKGDYDKHFISCSYHSSVLEKQKKLNRVLSLDERRKVYNDVIITFY